MKNSYFYLNSSFDITRDILVTAEFAMFTSLSAHPGDTTSSAASAQNNAGTLQGHQSAGEGFCIYFYDENH